MKKALMFLMAMGALDTANSQKAPTPKQQNYVMTFRTKTATANELIVNGDFEDSPCTTDYCISCEPNYVKGWIPEPQIEVGMGYYYNKYFELQRVLDLAPNGNGCVKQIVKGLTKGTYRLRFEYAARTELKGTECKFAVKFNGKVVKSITPPDDRIRTEVIEIEVGNETEGAIQFCSTNQDNKNAGALINDVSFARKTGNEVNPPPVVVPIRRPGENLIVNPNFQRHPCGQNICTYNTLQPNAVLGWAPDSELEIGYGSIYNQFLGDERVLELATGSNQCVRQVVRDLRPGLYDLTFEYTTRSEKPLAEGQFEVSLDGKVLSKVFPASDRIKNQTVIVDWKKGNEAVLRFCSLGPNNHEGAILKSVSMSRKKLADQPLKLKESSIFLDSKKAKCLQREFIFKGGKAEISFDYDVISLNIAKDKDAFVFVTLDGQPVYQISPCSSGKRLSIEADVKKGSRVLGFCFEGSKTQDLVHQIAISNIEIDQKPLCVPGLSEDLIRNGGFEFNECELNADYCIYNRHNLGRNVLWWMSAPEIEVGKAGYYNKDAWGQVALSYVAELDSNKNTCIRQRIPQITKGKYQLKFHYAARAGVPLETSGVEVRINGQAIKNFEPKSYGINKETLDFELDKTPSDPILEFCGTGKSDQVGATIDNIYLNKKTEC